MIELRPHQLEALDAMNDSDKGQIIVPTGGGKTMCMIEDVKRQFKSPVSKTIVVVAPRILLANQYPRGEHKTIAGWEGSLSSSPNSGSHGNSGCLTSTYLTSGWSVEHFPAVMMYALATPSK